MEGAKRREQIIRILKDAGSPVSGSELARTLNVSRQAVVQDIALLRASDRNIVSTPKGYLLFTKETGKFRRTFSVYHEKNQTEEELNIIVDNGGKVLDVIVEHEIYGQITAELLLENRRDVREFIKKLRSETARPLNILTDGRHLHTVEADSEEALDSIESELKEKNYLISCTNHDTLPDS